MIRPSCAVLFLALSLSGAGVLLMGCDGADGDAGPSEGEHPAVDLDALADRRAGTDGAKVELAAAEARSAGAYKVYASMEDEVGLMELEISAENAGLNISTQELIGGNIGGAVPSDLEKAAPRRGYRSIDMGLVEKAILARSKSYAACKEKHAPAVSGRMDMKIKVGRGGRAQSVAMAGGSQVTNRALGDCVASALKKIVYPEPRAPTATLTYGIRF